MRRERKGKTFRKTLGILLSAVMLVSGITFMPGSAIEVQAATTKDVNLGTGGIGNPTSTGSDATAWAGSKVYYAGKECYVLDKDGKLTGGKSSVDGNMLLLTQDVLSVKQMFDDDKSDWTASDCSIRNNLNSTTLLEANKGFLGTMTSVEQNSITALSISSSNTTNGGYTAYPSTTTTDKIFLLDLTDVNNANYGFGSKATRAISFWLWLRSPGDSDSRAVDVYPAGYVHSRGGLVGNESGSVRPAFNLNLSSVLFSSASGTSKSSFGLVGSNNVGNTWKLTLKDSDTSFAATLPKTGTAGQDITVTITTVGTGTYNQTSAILEDSTGTVVAYGKIGDMGAGDMTFTIPSTLSPGSYTLHVFEEQVNTGNSTDYASREVTETITISAAPSTYDVTITPGSNMTKTSSSGAASQTVNQESAITDVVYTANSGYYFPDNYSLPSGANGLSVAVNANKTQITVSGTPSATTAITLTAATEKATQSAPTSLSDGVDKIAGTTTSMEYASSANAVSWNACTADNTTVAAGTWYVRYKETDTQKAGAAASVIVTASPNPPTLYQVTVNNGSGEGTYAEGATVTITANVAPSGKVFDEWTVVSGTVTLASTTNATTSFTMPAGAVEVTATYKDAPVDPTPTPDPAPTPSTGTVSKDPTVIEAGAPTTTMNNTADDLKNKVLTSDELARVAAGESAVIYLDVKNIDSSITDSEQQLIAAQLGTDTLGIYLDISLYKKVGSSEAVKVTNPNGKVSVSIQIPAGLINTDTSKTRTYKIVRIYDGVASVIEGTYDSATQMFTFETDKFSTYALIYSDSSNSSNSGDDTTPAKDKVPKTGDSTPVVWLFVVAMISGTGIIYFGRKKRDVRS